MQFSWKNPLRALPVLLLFAAYAGAAFGVAGNVQFVVGDVKLITAAGVTRALQKGAEINEGDRVITAAGASAQIKMVDGGFIAIRPDTNMGFDTYRYSGKEDGTENAIVSLLRGGFRTITGIIGRKNKQNYLIRTETATIGIRGTDHEPMVILPPAAGQAAIAPAGTYDKVNDGIAFIRTDAGSIDIHRNQVGFAPVSKAAPVILPRIPPFYKPTPAPGPQKAKEEAKDEGKKEEAPAEIRDKAAVDPKSRVTAAAAADPVATKPVVALTARDASGATLNTTTQKLTTSSGTSTSISDRISSPVVATSNYGFGVIAAMPVTDGVDLVSLGPPAFSSTMANTNFVLKDKNLVEILQSPYLRFSLASQTQALIANADIRFTDGTAADAFSDPNGSYYMGRWSGGQIAVRDLAAASPVAPFADSLGAASAHWLVGLAPGNVAGTSINNVQQLVGTASYSLAAATHPTDGFGNVGTLNSATLSADFSTQTVDANLNLSFSSADPVNPSTRNLSLTAAATKMPIQASSFGAAVIAPLVAGIPPLAGTGNAVTCSGADCAADGYIGTIGGGFLASASGGSSNGAVGTGIGLHYGLIAIPTAASTTNPPFADYITGAAVLSTGAAPSVGTTAVPVTGGTGNYRHYLIGVQVVGTTTYNSSYTTASGVTLPAQNYLFDASGNLVRIQRGADYRLSDRGTSGAPLNTIGGAVPYTGTPGGLPSSPLSGTTVSFAGGTTPEGNYNDTVNGLRLGRYAGGTITTTDFSAPDNPLTYYTELGGNSFLWSLREVPASIPISGSFEYTPAYATKPTDSLGNVGTLDYASLAVNFTRQTVNPAVGITINNQNLAAAATNVPITSIFSFDASSSAAQNTAGGGPVRISCYGSNCAPAPVGSSGGYGGRFTGALAGSGTAGGAFFRYDFNTYYDPAVAAGVTGGIPTGQTRPVNDYIQGLVAFTKGTSVAALAPATATTGSQLINTTYFQPAAATPGGFFNQPWTIDYYPSATGYTSAFGTGSPNSVTDYDPGNSTPHSETLTGGTVTQAPANASSFAATGISFGRYNGGTLTGIDWRGNAFSYANLGNYAWIKGPAPAPLLIDAMFGTAKYVYDGGTLPSTITGSTGSVNSAVLAVNFSASSVGVDLSVSAPSQNWTATTTASGVLTGSPATSMKLNGGNFWGSSWQASNPSLHESLFVKLNNGPTNDPSIGGRISGQLMGAGLNGAGLTYAFEDMSSAPGTGVNGAVAFALDSFTYSGGTITTTGTSAIDLSIVPYAIRFDASGLRPGGDLAEVDPEFLTRIEGGANTISRLPLGTEGLPLMWDRSRATLVTPTCTPPVTCPAYVVRLPARASIDPSSFVPTGGTPVGQQAALPAGMSAARVLESGFDAATGMRWGRYGGGVVAVFDRINGSLISTPDLTTANWHIILGPVQVGATMLPVTGTYTYTNVGGTKPTDNLGSAAGTLNAATLVADFAAQTVNAGVNLTVNNQTWAAGGTAIPIQERTYFKANRSPSGTGNLNICVGSTCGTTTLPTASSLNTSGKIVGAFNGTSGQGLGMAYSLNQGGVAGTTVTGVAAFKQ